MDERLFEKLSALADGELPLSDAELAFAALDTPEGWAVWNAYHQIGHTLRSDHFGADLRPGFQVRLAQRLAAEAGGSPPAGVAGAGDSTLLPAAAASADSGLP